VLIDGKEAARVGVGNNGGDPIRLLVAAANHAAARGGLGPGDLVTTGSCTGLVFATPGAEVVAEFAGWGEVRVAFER
jgi:2-keto-4-pentenoate hydratase